MFLTGHAGKDPRITLITRPALSQPCAARCRRGRQA